MILTWVRYNIQATYIDTKLGIVWIILQPILQTLIYTFAFGTLLGQSPRGDVPFILFFLAGLTTWTFINNNWMQSGHLIVKNIHLMDQIKISAEAIVLVQLAESFVEFLINFIILFIATLLYGYPPTLAYLYLPLVLAFIVVMTLGGMFYIASMGVFIRDIPNIVSMVLRLMFFVSGVIITPDMLSGTAGNLLEINPVLVMIESVRDIVVYAQSPSPISLLYSGAFALLAFMIGYLHFRKRQGTFVDYR